MKAPSGFAENAAALGSEGGGKADRAFQEKCFSCWNLGISR